MTPELISKHFRSVKALTPAKKEAFIRRAQMIVSLIANENDQEGEISVHRIITAWEYPELTIKLWRPRQKVALIFTCGGEKTFYYKAPAKWQVETAAHEPTLEPPVVTLPDKEKE